jgi:predicted Zn-dependent protease
MLEYEAFATAAEQGTLAATEGDRKLQVILAADVAGCSRRMQDDDAVTMYRRAIEERPSADWILRNLVSALVGAGRMEDAAAELKKPTAAYPDLTVTNYRNAMVFSPALLDRMCASLRTVGLPE